MILFGFAVVAVLSLVLSLVIANNVAGKGHGLSGTIAALIIIGLPLGFVRQLVAQAQADWLPVAIVMIVFALIGFPIGFFNEDPRRR